MAKIPGGKARLLVNGKVVGTFDEHSKKDEISKWEDEIDKWVNEIDLSFIPFDWDNLPLTDAGSDNDKIDCNHEYINVGFSLPKMVCKHCDEEKV